MRPLQGRHGGLHVSRLRAHGAPPTLKPNLRHFQSSEIKNKDRLFVYGLGRTNKEKLRNSNFLFLFFIF